MNLIFFALAGVLFNLFFVILTDKMHMHFRGIDSMPVLPIAAGFFLGAWTGGAVGAILSVTYHIMRPSTMSSLPMTFTGNVLAGMLGSLLSFAGLFSAGIIVLLIYHIVSLAMILAFSQPSPGYITFMALNSVTNIILLIILGGILG